MAEGEGEEGTMGKYRTVGRTHSWNYRMSKFQEEHMSSSLTLTVVWEMREKQWHMSLGLSRRDIRPMDLGLVCEQNSDGSCALGSSTLLFSAIWRQFPLSRFLLSRVASFFFIHPQQRILPEWEHKSTAADKPVLLKIPAVLQTGLTLHPKSTCYPYLIKRLHFSPFNVDVLLH